MKTIALLCFFTLAAQTRAQTPALTPPAALAGDAQIQAAAGDQQQSAIAAGSDGALVAWADRRATLSNNAGAGESGLDIWIQKLSSDGTPATPTPVCAAFLPGDDVRPRVSWGGSSWLVSWSSQAPQGSIFSAAIVGVRVGSDGTLLDSTPFVILNQPNTLVTQHASASDGQQWVVVSGESTSGLPGICAVRVSAAGIVLDAQPVVLQPAQFSSGVDIAWAQGSFLLVWNQYSGATGEDIRARRYGSTLVPQGSATFTVAATPYTEADARCVSNGNEFLVVWTKSLSGTGELEIRAARVSATGQVLDPAGLTISANMPFHTTRPASAWDGTQWFVGWTYFFTKIARISTAGAVLEFDGFPFQPTATMQQAELSMAGATGGGIRLCWTDSRQGSNEGLDIHSARIQSPAQIGADVPVALGAPAQLNAAMASSGTAGLLVCRSETSGAGRLIAARLNAQGQPLDAEPIPVTDDPAVMRGSVGWDGSRYLVVWSRASDNQIVYRRFLPDGNPLDGLPVIIGPGSNPDVVGNNGEFLISYVRAVNSFPIQQYPMAVLLNGATGVVQSGPTTLSAGSGYAVQTDACVTPNGYVIAWQRNYSISDTHSDIQAVLMDGFGSAAAPFLVAGAFNTYQGEVRVASSGAEVLFVWRSGNSSNLTRRIETRRMTVGGAFIDPLPVRLVTGLAAEQFLPAVAWDGTQYWCVFQDLRNNSAALDQRSDVYGARMLASGWIRDPQGFLIERSGNSETHPQVVAHGAGRVLTAASRLEAQTPHAAYRIRTRVSEGDCPSPSAYCIAKQTSILTFPAIGWSGQPSVGAGSVIVTVQQGLPGKLAMLLRAGAPAATPFFNGTLCLQPPLVRTPAILLDASGSGASALTLDVGQLGSLRYHQWWMRDPAHPDGTGVALSNALQFLVCP